MEIKEKIIKIKTWIKEFFLFDGPKRYFIEIAVAVFIFFGILYGFNSKFIVFLFLIWAIFGFFGFFITSCKFFYTFSAPGSENIPLDFGIPISMTLSSKGGFIANRKIKIKIEVMDLTDNNGKVIKRKEDFLNLYDEFQIVYFNSIKIPLKIGGFINNQPEAGGVCLIDKNKKFLKAESDILFNSIGDYYGTILYKKVNDSNPHHQKMENKNFMDSQLCISPAENYVSIRNYSVMYALTVIILLLTLIQARIIN
ncbi:MAG TPA: hypothetical protein P5232_04490 [Candidatus Moranbacteria bacterium]|nr:hypothetical protein [Candidatus Moranbacteria bacterium]